MEPFYTVTGWLFILALSLTLLCFSATYVFRRWEWARYRHILLELQSIRGKIKQHYGDNEIPAALVYQLLFKLQRRELIVISEMIDDHEDGLLNVPEPPPPVDIGRDDV